MNRRDAVRFIPAAIGGLICLPVNVLSIENDSLPLSLQYLRKVRGILEKIQSTESDNLLEASYHIAKTVKNKGTCYTTWDVGHNIGEDMYPGRNGDPEIFTLGYPEDKVKNGDLLLGGIIARKIEDPRKKGVYLIGSPVPWCGDTPDAYLLSEQHQQYKIRPYSDLWIETYSTTYGPIMWLAGAHYPMGAVSGVVGMVTYWMMIADAVRILAADGITVKVKGDEPKLTDKAHYVGLNKPLGEDYFKEVLHQLNQVESEIGTSDKIAEIAVDTILSGNKVYVYSKYWEGLAIETNTRMGGLCIYTSVFQNGPEGGLVKNFKGTSKDFVIMGITKPDDEDDLAFLDICKKSGIKTASIGPATRDGVLPTGKNVAFGTDMHLGFMCDTYGLFAVPGYEKKICPTSGAVQNQLFYAVSMRAAELIIERTGNLPTIYPNGAFEGSPYNEFGRVHAIGLKRGY
ncbi:MAG: hypothetical protein WCU00_10965 [Candidatus Latescibacterota bacterium]